MNPSTEALTEKLTNKSKSLIKKTVEKFTDKDIKLIADASFKIRSLNNKTSESRREFVSNFSKHHDTYRKVINTFEELANETTAYGDTKKNCLAYYVQLIREREKDQGVDQYLLNEVKYGFMKSIVKWIDTPGDLDKTSKIAKKDSSTKSKKKSAKLKANKLVIKIIETKVKSAHWELDLSLTNNSDIPLQNIELSFVTTDDKKLLLSEVAGDLISLTKKNKTAKIAFLQASMDEESKSWNEFMIKGPNIDEFENLSKITSEIENTKDKITETEVFELD